MRSPYDNDLIKFMFIHTFLNLISKLYIPTLIEKLIRMYTRNSIQIHFFIIFELKFRLAPPIKIRPSSPTYYQTPTRI